MGYGVGGGLEEQQAFREDFAQAQECSRTRCSAQNTGRTKHLSTYVYSRTHVFTHIRACTYTPTHAFTHEPPTHTHLMKGSTTEQKAGEQASFLQPMVSVCFPSGQFPRIRKGRGNFPTCLPFPPGLWVCPLLPDLNASVLALSYWTGPTSISLARWQFETAFPKQH